MALSEYDAKRAAGLALERSPELHLVNSPIPERLDQYKELVEKAGELACHIHQPEEGILSRIQKNADVIFVQNGKYLLPFPHILVQPDSEKTLPNWQGVLYNWDIVGFGIPATYLVEQTKGEKVNRRKKLTWFDVRKGTLDDYKYLFEHLQRVPNASSIVLADCSQPDMGLGQRALEVYRQGKEKGLEGMNEWLTTYATFLEANWQFWEKGEKHQVEGTPLIRFSNADTEANVYRTYAESGRDIAVNRFAGRPHDFLPIDLNSLHCANAMQLAAIYKTLGNEQKAEEWEEKAFSVKEAIQTLLWNDADGMFYDWDLGHPDGQQQSRYPTLAAFYTLYTGVATQEQAQKLVDALHLFQTPQGLQTVTTQEKLPSFSFEEAKEGLRRMGVDVKFVPTFVLNHSEGQWDRDVWANDETIAVKGMLRYGFMDEAAHVLLNALASFQEHFSKTNGHFPESRDGYSGRNGNSGHYPKQQNLIWSKYEVLFAERALQAIHAYNIGEIPSIPEWLYS